MWGVFAGRGGRWEVGGVCCVLRSTFPSIFLGDLRGLLGVPGAPVSPFPFPPGPHPRRGLEGRRDVVTIEAGGHQIQSVSLSRAMAGAFITEVRAPGRATRTPMTACVCG